MRQIFIVAVLYDFCLRIHKRGFKMIDIAFCYVKSLALECNHDCRIHTDKKI